MPELKIAVRDKVATGDGSRIVCGNSDYMAVFSFDEEWAAYDVKTARFVYPGGAGDHIDVVFDGDTCPVPVLHGTIGVKVGVFAGELHTTTSAWFDCEKSILCGGGPPADPLPDVYAQIMELVNSFGGASPESVAKAVAAYMAEHPIEERDPTVPDWAKSDAKPKYTASEVGARPNTWTPTASDVGAVPTGRKVNGKALSEDVTLSAEDVNARPATWTPSAADVGARPSTWTPTASDVGAVPTSRKVNGKALSEDITLSAADVNARPATWTPSAADVGARPSNWTPTASDVGAVPTGRKVNGKALSADITLSAADVNARPATWTPSAADVGARPSSWTPTASDVGAVPTSRKVNGKALSADISLSAEDVGARPSTWTPTASDVGALPASTKIPDSTTDLANDSGFITKAVNDLENYYKKSETLTKAEIQNLVSAIPKFRIEVVDALPFQEISDSVVYLVKSGETATDLYTEYIFIPESGAPTNGNDEYDSNYGTWEKLGTQSVDLSGYALKSEIPAVPVKSVNGKTGAVVLSAEDVNARPSTWTPSASEVGARPNTWTPTAAEVGAVPTSRKVNGKALSADVSLSAEDVGARPSTWTPSSADVGARPNTWTPTASDVGAVPTGRKVNGKALSADISLSAEDVGARPSTWTPSASEVGARPSSWTPTASDVGAVPTSRKVNGKALSADITLSAADVNARPSTWTPTASDVGARPNTWTPSASDVGAVPTSRKVNGKALSSDISLSAADVGAVPTTSAITVTGVDADGVTHTWTMYGVSV